MDAELKEIKSKILALEQDNETFTNENRFPFSETEWLDFIYLLYRRLAFEKSELEEKYTDSEEKLIMIREELGEQISNLSEDLERLRQENREKDEELQILLRKGGGGGVVSDLSGILDSQ